MQLVMAGPIAPSLEPVSMTGMFMKIVRGRADSDDYQHYLEIWDQLASSLTRRSALVQDESWAGNYGQPHARRGR